MRGPRHSFTGQTMLEVAQRWMMQHIYRGGCECPLCGTWNQVYDRQLNDRIVRVMFAMYHRNRAAGGDGTGWVYMPTIDGKPERRATKPSTSGEFAFAKHWDLIEKMTGRGSRGQWRLTEKGVRFLRRLVTIPKHAWVFQNEVLEFTGPEISVTDALDNPFDYDALMRGSAQAYLHIVPPPPPEEEGSA